MTSSVTSRKLASFYDDTINITRRFKVHYRAEVEDSTGLA